MGYDIAAEDGILDIGFIDPDEAEFYQTEGGFTGLRYKDGDYRHVIFRRVMPVQLPQDYICVTDHENKEIGIIKTLSGLREEQQVIVMQELDKRYYCPEIMEIKSIKDKLGYVYMELKLRHKNGAFFIKNCAIKDVNKNIRMLNENSLIIFDVDGNRYIVTSLADLDKKSMRRLEPFMF